MRITFVLRVLSLSGGGRVLAEYAKRLQAHGHKVTVVVPAPARPTMRETLRSLLKNRTLPTLTSRPDSHLADSGLECRIVKHRQTITESDVPNADVVIASWWEAVEWMNAFSPRKGEKVHFIQHYEVFPYLPVERVKATWRLPLNKILISRWLADIARDEYGIHNVDLVPNAVDTDQFFAPTREKNPTPTVGMMYWTTPFKGFEFGLKAFDLASRTLPGLRLLSFGAEEVSPQLPLPPLAQYQCRPPQHELRNWYAGCDAWLFTSRSEGFGLPILEAMACRTPVIGTPAGAAPELLDGRAGILVDPDDPSDMAEAIARVCRLPPPEWRAMSDAAYATATRYNWDDAALLFEKALERAAGRMDRPAKAGGFATGPMVLPAKRQGRIRPRHDIPADLVQCKGYRLPVRRNGNMLAVRELLPVGTTVSPLDSSADTLGTKPIAKGGPGSAALTIPNDLGFSTCWVTRRVVWRSTSAIRTRDERRGHRYRLLTGRKHRRPSWARSRRGSRLRSVIPPTESRVGRAGRHTRVLRPESARSHRVLLGHEQAQRQSRGPRREGLQASCDHRA